MDGVPAELAGWIALYGYPLMFVAMVLEGPAVTTLAALGASLGYFNIFIVYLLAFLGDWLTDIIYYLVGYWGRERVIDRYGRRVGITEERIRRIEAILKNHSVMGLAILKLIPIVPTIGLITAGAIRLRFKTFLGTVTAVILVTSSIYTAVGFFFGQAYKQILGAINNISIAILVLAVLAAIILYIYRALRLKLERRFQKEELKLN